MAVLRHAILLMSCLIRCPSQVVVHVRDRWYDGLNPFLLDLDFDGDLPRTLLMFVQRY